MITHLSSIPYYAKIICGHSFSPRELIVSLPTEWGKKTIAIDVEVVDAPIDYNFILGHSWIHVIMAIVSLVS